MNPIEMTAELYRCRKAARSLLGAHYQRDMDLWAKLIKAHADKDECSELAAAITLAKKAPDGYASLCVLAAYVEMTEPEPVKNACALPNT